VNDLSDKWFYACTEWNIAIRQENISSESIEATVITVRDIDHQSLLIIN
jgi:hypothetical protein